MRLAVISDIHGNIRALEAVLTRIHALRDIERLVVAGDLLSGPLEPSATAEVLMSLEASVIRGNHERQLLACAEAPGGASDQYAFEHTTVEQRAWLGTLPATL
ncbi:MAG: metallophosphoesterase family protein, partial [Myxococcaceae bacterium]